jgi:hypothetical protein
MGANPIQTDPNIKYPEKWTPIEFVCKCGVKRRVMLNRRVPASDNLNQFS